MANTDTSSISGLLKNIYDNYVEKIQNLNTMTMDEVGKSAKKYNAAGNGFFGAINDYGNEAGGAINETESFRTIDSEHYQQYKVVPKVITWPVQFSGLVAKAAEGDEESFANGVLEAIDSARDRMRKDENRQFFGLGTGLLAKLAVSATAAGTLLTVDTTQYLRANMVIDIYNGATKTVASHRITYVDPYNSQIGLAVSLGVTVITTDHIVKENIRASSPASDGKEMMGLRGIVDDSTDLTTFQNLDATSTYLWRSVRIAASSANLTSDLLQRLEDDVNVLSGDTADFFVTHTKQRRKYLDLVTPEKRFMDGKMDAGFTKLSFNGKDFFLDNDCQTDTVYLLKRDKLRKFELEPISMAGFDGSDKYLRISNQDAYQTYWKHYCNFGTSKRNCHGKITGLAVPSGISGGG
jgi:hypothetical protein